MAGPTNSRHPTQPSDGRLVFIGGLQRSGTTLLARLLMQHPAIAGLVGTPTPEDEGQFLQDVYKDDHQLGMARGRLRGTTIRWAFNPEAHLTELDAAAVTSPRERLLTAWQPYWSQSLATWFVEKSPSNLTRTRFLQAVFPEARFLIITRHPVTQALATRKWGTVAMKMGFHLDRILDHWVTAMDLFRADAAHLRSLHVVAYENLVAQPEQELRSIYSFLDVDPIATPLDQVRADHRYAAYWSWMTRSNEKRPGGIIPGNRGRDRLYRALDGFVVRATRNYQTGKIDARYRERLREYGYSLHDVSSSEGWNS